MKTFKNLFCIFIVSVMLVGCSSSITKEKYNKVEKVSTYKEVIKIIGKPKEESSAKLKTGDILKNSNWKDGDKEIMISFKNDKIISLEQFGLK
ncbi:DUF3862 domain-containing protein [Clostridium estertheticum]|uniref:DUF3862 domain-containing protein n=1 Tax=Clostridium estertheticum TaxID=238834 RepID=UPI001C7CD710|nr:DUF3862 domain-containing protein [Clostridium estertheticum]MBX4262350.1 DUF3862 domain-containing protein [Clostridium estertheticum]WLC71639.1 DUF3862 domain-containing protein [Clostridium estertheticum]